MRQTHTKRAYITWKSTHNAVDAVLWAVCKGWLDKSDASLASRDYTLPTGDFNKGNNRMNSSKRFTLQYIDFILAVVVTLGRCERCWSGALSRNSHRGSINLWCPADKRPTDRLGAVTWQYSQSGFLAALGEYLPNATHHSWVWLSTKPRRAVNRWATTNALWDWLPCSCGWVVCQLSALLEWVEWVFDIKTLFGGLGGYPWKSKGRSPLH